MTRTFWTPEQDKILRAAYKSRTPASDIALLLDNRTPMAVRKRIEWMRANGIEMTKDAPFKPCRQPQKKKKAERHAHINGMRIFGSKSEPRKTRRESGFCQATAEAVMALHKRQCRWPEGEPESGITFCSETAVAESSYCAKHHKRAWAGKPPRTVEGVRA